MKVSSLYVAPNLFPVVPWFIIASIISVRRVVAGIIDIKEWTSLTERILGGIVCVIPYVERRILKVRLLAGVVVVSPCHTIF